MRIYGTGRRKTTEHENATNVSVCTHTQQRWPALNGKRRAFCPKPLFNLVIRFRHSFRYTRSVDYILQLVPAKMNADTHKKANCRLHYPNKLTYHHQFIQCKRWAGSELGEKRGAMEISPFYSELSIFSYEQCIYCHPTHLPRAHVPQCTLQIAVYYLCKLRLYLCSSSRQFTPFLPLLATQLPSFGGLPPSSMVHLPSGSTANIRRSFTVNIYCFLITLLIKRVSSTNTANSLVRSTIQTHTEML